MVEADLIAFSISSALTLASAIGVAVSKKMFYSAIFLAATLVGVAFTFLLMGAEFLFIVQILVYVGAITTLILFAIMFTHQGSTEEAES